MRIISKAPGRVCLFGDHQDYLGLPIIACSIDRYATISGVPNTKGYFQIAMPDIDQVFDIRFRESVPQRHTNYLIDALTVVARYGCIPNKGYDITLSSTVPINAGLSSSSAIVVAWVQWLLHTFGCDREITPQFIGQLAYEAEVLEKNGSGGKMDQYTSAIGNIIYLETDQTARIIQLKSNLTSLIVAESGIPKDTQGLLGNLKHHQLSAIKTVMESHPEFDIYKATSYDVGKYKDLLATDQLPYFYAAIQNHLITQKALFQFQRSNKSMDAITQEKIGTLMTAHHTVLKESLCITTPKIDTMIDAALEAGAYGAKIVGSGGGGSVCALAPEGKEEQIIDSLKNAGSKNAYTVRITKGAHII